MADFTILQEKIETIEERIELMTEMLQWITKYQVNQSDINKDVFDILEDITQKIEKE